MKQLSIKKAQAGFTLIELVVVIVILGILAVTAAPKFIDIQEDARTATLNAIKASMQSASTLVHSKSLIAGNENSAPGASVTVKVNGTDLDIAYGYPRSDDKADWVKLLDVKGSEFVSDDASVSGTVIFYPAGRYTASDTITLTSDCIAYYTEVGTSGNTPTIETVPCV